MRKHFKFDFRGKRPIVTPLFMLQFILLAFFLSLSLPETQANPAEKLVAAARNNQVEQVRKLLRSGADPNAADSGGTPAIVLAATYKAFDVVRLLIEQKSLKIDAAGPGGETALAVAAWHGELELVKLMVGKGAQINRPGWTPLHYASAAGHEKLVRYLLDESAYIDAQSPNKTTPLMMAARERQTHIVKLLLDAGADPTQVNDAGLSAADYLDRHQETALAALVRDKAREFKEKYLKPKPQPGG